MIIVPNLPIKIQNDNSNISDNDISKSNRRKTKQALLEYQKHVINKYNIYYNKQKVLGIK